MTPAAVPLTTRAARLGFQPPLCAGSLFGHLAATAVPGVEEWRDGAYRRTLRLPHGPGVVALRVPEPGAEHVEAALRTDPRDHDRAVAACRRILDLDADPARIDTVLRADPVLARVVDADPGRRVPGAAGPAEFAVRAVLGQQVSTAAARTHAGRLVQAHGEPVEDPDGGLSRLFPSPAALCGLDPAALALPQARRRTLIGVVQALAALGPDLDADLDAVHEPGGDARAAVLAALTGLPGVGPWTLDSVAMRALGDADAFLPGDLGVRLAARRLGLPERPAALTRYAQRWRPVRAYAVQYLWATGDHPVNHLPAG